MRTSVTYFNWAPENRCMSYSDIHELLILPSKPIGVAKVTLVTKKTCFMIPHKDDISSYTRLCITNAFRIGMIWNRFHEVVMMSLPQQYPHVYGICIHSRKRQLKSCSVNTIDILFSHWKPYVYEHEARLCYLCYLQLWQFVTWIVIKQYVPTYIDNNDWCHVPSIIADAVIYHETLSNILSMSGQQLKVFRINIIFIF